MLLHQVRYRDGAVLIDRDGRLLASNVILRPTKASEQAVPAMGGTRHTSAARHTYDCPDVLAFVVSIDGPVTVFSDGLRIADLKMLRAARAENVRRDWRRILGAAPGRRSGRQGPVP